MCIAQDTAAQTQTNLLCSPTETMLLTMTSPSLLVRKWTQTLLLHVLRSQMLYHPTATIRPKAMWLSIGWCSTIWTITPSSWHLSHQTYFHTCPCCMRMPSGERSSSHCQHDAGTIAWDLLLNFGDDILQAPKRGGRKKNRSSQLLSALTPDGMMMKLSIHPSPIHYRIQSPPNSQQSQPNWRTGT